MNFLQLAKDRYSCRKLSDRPVEPEKIDRILEAAQAAPTATNAQPYHIWVLESPEALEKIRTCTSCHFDAKVLMLVGGDEKAAWVRQFDGRNFADVDATIVATQLMLAVQAEGLGTTWVGWFDPDGVRYSVPVNTHRPSYSIYSTLSWRQPLGAEKNWTLGLGLSCNLAASTGYQARGRKAGMNLATFDYNAFMTDFWGDESGSRFYGGQSGFAESRTKQAYYSGYLSVEYSLDRFTSSFYAEVENNRSRYSLDPSANTTFWDFNYSLDLLYETRNGWEFKSTATYRHFLGYSAGYDKPYCTWDLGVSKTVKAFTLSLGVSDLLNQARSLQRIADAEYIEDSYRLVMGRYALFSVKWNFGKMNPAKNGRVQDAMYNML